MRYRAYALPGIVYFLISEAVGQQCVWPTSATPTGIVNASNKNVSSGVFKRLLPFTRFVGGFSQHFLLFTSNRRRLYHQRPPRRNIHYTSTSIQIKKKTTERKKLNKMNQINRLVEISKLLHYIVRHQHTSGRIG